MKTHTQGVVAGVPYMVQFTLYTKHLDNITTLATWKHNYEIVLQEIIKSQHTSYYTQPIALTLKFFKAWSTLLMDHSGIRPISFISGDIGKHCPSSWSWMFWQQPLRCPCATSANSCGAIDLSRSQKFLTYSTIQFWSPLDSCRWLRNVGVASVWGPNTFWLNQAILQGRCLEAAVAFQSLVLISFQSS
jgi:hypothetical protein